jgi:hypothetical protein
MLTNRLLIFAHDSGSANVTMAYAYLNQNKYTQILAFPKGPAINIYKQHISDYICEEPIHFVETDTVITGTSGIHSNYELEIITKAKQSKVHKVITILDNTANFELRFSTYNELIKKSYLPDEIWISDKKFKSKIPYINEKIIYKKNIYDKYIKKLFKKNSPILKDENIIKYKGTYLLVLTEYLSELYGNKFGFSEFDFLIHVFESINKINQVIPIFLKLHPAEEATKYDELLKNYSNLTILKCNSNIQELVYYSKVVFGINSSVFKEAKIFKKPAYSLLIGTKKNINSILKKDQTIRNKKKLDKILKLFFNENVERN